MTTKIEVYAGENGFYTMRRGDEFVSCINVMIMEVEDEEWLDMIFDEWKAAAQEGEEGYGYWVEDPLSA